MNDNGSLITLTGTVENIIYCNKENGYCVMEISAAGESEPVVIVGALPYVCEGEEIVVHGGWTYHADYGKQFRVESFEKHLPADENAILRYLSSRTVKGIGPATAIKIVDKFGRESFDVIEKHPDWLADIPGISRKKAYEISKDFCEQAGVRSLMIFCREFLSAAMTMRVYKKFGGAAVDVIKANPYRLCDEVDGIGFDTADEIAVKLGVCADDAARIKSGLKYLLSFNAAQSGHACVPMKKLIEAAEKLLGVGTDIIGDALKAALIAGQLLMVRRDGGSYIYLREYLDTENYIARKLKQIDKASPRYDATDIERLISREEIEEGITYASLQKTAIYEAMSAGVFILTGGPGTGKTTVIRALLRIFTGMRLSTALCAPTGRAAKRMSEATGQAAKTIHRLLEAEYKDEQSDTIEFSRDEHNLLDEDVIIVDEASMIDMFLMRSLLRAVRPGARLILIGDSDQLPSVGAGNVLCDIISSGELVTVRLTEIFRQAKESLIITNAHRINAGEMPELTRADNDFFFVPRTYGDEIAHAVVDLYVNRLPKTYGDEICDKIQIISPSRRGRAGVQTLNPMLQQVINPPDKSKREKQFRDVVFREGDKVMQIRNNYELEWKRAGQSGSGIFNGDIGRIIEIDMRYENMLIEFDDREVVYDFALLDELEHAYAITVHKSQGSEYPVVIIPMYDFPEMLMTRNLLYTAVTRAKEMVIMVGRRDVVEKMVENNRHILRYTGLAYFLRDGGQNA